MFLFTVAFALLLCAGFYEFNTKASHHQLSKQASKSKQMEYNPHKNIVSQQQLRAWVKEINDWLPPLTKLP